MHHFSCSCCCCCCWCCRWCHYSLLFIAITCIVGVVSGCYFCWRFFKIVAASFCWLCCCFRCFYTFLYIFFFASLLTTALLAAHSHACLFHLLLCFTRLLLFFFLLASLFCFVPRPLPVLRFLFLSFLTLATNRPKWLFQLLWHRKSAVLSVSLLSCCK